MEHWYHFPNTKPHGQQGPERERVWASPQTGDQIGTERRIATGKGNPLDHRLSDDQSVKRTPSAQRHDSQPRPYTVVLDRNGAACPATISWAFCDSSILPFLAPGHTCFMSSMPPSAHGARLQAHGRSPSERHAPVRSGLSTLAPNAATSVC